MPITLVLADDHPIYLDGLTSLFLGEPEFEVLACCYSGEEALEVTRQLKPDILVLDINMPRGDGISVLHELKEEGNATKVVLLTATMTGSQFVSAFDLGVEGMILKEQAPQQLIECVLKVHAGGRHLEPPPRGRPSVDVAAGGPGRVGAAILTPRELEIIRLVSEGLRNKEISRRLFIAEGTVKLHLHNIYEKLGVRSRLKLVLYAQTMDIV